MVTVEQREFLDRVRRIVGEIDERESCTVRLGSLFDEQRNLALITARSKCAVSRTAIHIIEHKSMSGDLNFVDFIVRPRMSAMLAELDAKA